MRRPRSTRRTIPIDPVEELHVAEAAPASPRADAGRLRDHIDQLALVDAHSGAWDVEALEALAHRLPRVNEIDLMVARVAAEARQGQREVQTVGQHHIGQARHRTRGSDGVVRSQGALKDEIEILAQALTRTGSQRERAGSVLRGEVAEHGVRWTGQEPPEPLQTSRLALALRAQVLTYVLLHWVAPLVAAVVEGVICWDLMHGELRVDDGWRPLAYALPLVLFLALLPHVIGHEVATALRAEHPRRAQATALVLAGVWIAAVLVIAHERTTQIRTAALNRLALQDGVSAAQVPENLLGSVGWNLSFWAAALVGVGGSLIALQAVHANPVLGQALRLDTTLTLLRTRLTWIRAELEMVNSAVIVQELAHTENEKAWEHYCTTTLPALREELFARYREQFLCALADPDATTAVPVEQVIVLPTDTRILGIEIDLREQSVRNETGEHQ